MTTISLSPADLAHLLLGETVVRTGGPTIVLRLETLAAVAVSRPPHLPQVASEPSVDNFPQTDPKDLTCAKCGSVRGSLRSKAQYERRCTGAQKIPYEKRWAGSAPKGSSCCGSRTRIGPPHEEGNHYCTTCGLPCLWSKGQLPPGPLKSFICRGMKNCPRLTEYKDGYCLPCWEKRRPHSTPAILSHP